MRTYALTVPVAACCVSIALSGVAAAQDRCAALLKHGIYNYYDASTSSRQRDEAFSLLCSQRAEIERNKVGISLPIGDGRTPVALTYDTASSLAAAACSTSTTVHDLQTASSTLIKQLSSEAVGAWAACVNASAQHLQLTPTIQPFTDLGLGGTRQIVLDVDWIAGGGASALHIDDIVEDGFTCSGTLKERKGQDLPPRTSASLTCLRMVETTPIELGSGNRVFARDASVTVRTNTGSIVMQEPAIKAAPTVAELAGRIADLERRLNGTKLTFAPDTVAGIVHGATEDTRYQYGRGNDKTLHDGQPFGAGELAVMVGQWDGTGTGEGKSWNYYRLLQLIIPPPR